MFFAAQTENNDGAKLVTIERERGRKKNPVESADLYKSHTAGRSQMTALRSW